MSEPTTTPAATKEDQDHAKSTLFVRGIPYDATSKDLETFFSDVGPIRKCFVITEHRGENAIKEGEPGFKNKGFGYVHYALAEDAQQALQKLSSAKFKGGRKLKMELARRRKETTGEHSAKHPQPKPSTRPASTEKSSTTTSSGTPNTSSSGQDKAARLIVRNLPWKYREADLMKVFGEKGKVVDVKLPRKFDKGPLRGFAFIQYEKVEEAESAVESLNATEHHGRTIAVDWALSKDRFKKMEAAEDAEGDTKMEEAKNDDEGDDDSSSSSSSDDSSDDDSDSSDEDDEGDDEEQELESDAEEQELESDAEEQELESDVKEQDEDDKKAKPAHRFPEVSDGTTLFVRNLLFETTEDDLKDLFKQWGPVVYARITRDKESGLSRGNGFVCMRNKDDADKCLEEADALRKMSVNDATDDQTALNSLMSKREKKKSNLAYSSILTPDAGSGEGRKFTLHGRVLDVTRALDRQSAQKMKDDKDSLKKKDDVRNLYLMREGVIFPNTPAAETITPSELQKRQMSFSQRKKFISGDPSLFISKTRLSIRNLPVKVDEIELRKLGMDSIQKFKEQVKRGIRTDLTKTEKEEGWQYKPRVKQAKIVRSKDRIDSATQKQRSKGYGFLEFLTHSHALASLRYLNNNPDLYDGKRLTVEFSLENSKVMERRSQRGPDGKITAERQKERDDKKKERNSTQRQDDGGRGGSRGGRGASRGASRGDRGGRGASRGGRGASRGDRGGRGASRGGAGRGAKRQADSGSSDRPSKKVRQ
ncbi:hypothetical protein BCR42DRAFT_381797 [Absidia repens]|uniref:RRM domain-containing protein n=1 Tax=Absidia repens TaxID=90262 RepID=A0A1X2I4A4_9FUNG|nr:hypothetical protein BCR42DRAFT_381797 [Absidia repens]